MSVKAFIAWFTSSFEVVTLSPLNNMQYLVQEGEGSCDENQWKHETYSCWGSRKIELKLWNQFLLLFIWSINSATQPKFLARSRKRFNPAPRIILVTKFCTLKFPSLRFSLCIYEGQLKNYFLPRLCHRFVHWQLFLLHEIHCS